MTESDKNLLFDLDNRRVDVDYFTKHFSVDLKADDAFIRSEIEKAIQESKQENLDLYIQLLQFSSNIEGFVDILNRLLINPYHRRHQWIARTLQVSAPSQSSIPYIRHALETGFDYLEYTGSENEVIAKWFSWLLYSIGTEDAISLIREFANSKDVGIAQEMKYRLQKIEA